MNSQTALNYNNFVEAKIQLAKDIYNNGPKNNDPDSLLLAEHFADLKQQELELKQHPDYAKLVADDFTEDYQSSLRLMERAINNDWLDSEIIYANQLFQTVINKFNNVIAANPPESWIPVAKQFFDKASQYLERDEERHEFDQFQEPNIQALLANFRKNYYEVRKITGKFLYEHANADPILPTNKF